MYALYVTPHARKELAKVEKHYQKKIATALLLIRQNPYSGKKLTGEFKGQYATRVWPYRVVYNVKVQEKMVVITNIGHRQGIYK